MGDGLNDAGALKESYTGIAVSDNVNNFSPACDAILDASAFKHLPNLLRFSKVSMSIIYFSYIISFLYNVIGIWFAVMGNLSPVIAAVIMPLSTVTIILFTTLSGNIAAFRLHLASFKKTDASTNHDEGQFFGLIKVISLLKTAVYF